MSIEILVAQILKKMSNLNVWTSIFIPHILHLICSFQGRHNFVNLARYGHLSELSYRNWYGKGFDFYTFNYLLLSFLPKEEHIIAFDPSYISKSGKHTPGLGKYCSGCAGAAKWGLELCGFAAIGLSSRLAFHLDACQTIKTDKETLVDFYIRILKERKEQLLKVSDILVVDAYFSKEKYISEAKDMGFTVISRFRKDVALTCPYEEKPTGKRGRPKKYGDKVALKQLKLT